MDNLNFSEELINSVLSTTLDSVELGAALIDNRGVIQWVNKNMGDWFGPKERLISSPCEVIFQEKLDICCFDDGAVRPENCAVDISHTYPDGSMRYFNLSLNPIESPLLDKYRYIMLIREITEQVQFEKTLQETEARFHSILEATPAGIALVDLDGNVIYVNQKGLNLFGYSSQEEVSGRKWFTFFSEMERSEINEIIDQLVSGKVLREVPALMFKQDGSSFLVRLSAIAMYEDTQPNRLLVSMQDIFSSTKSERIQEAINQVALVAGSATRLEDIYPAIHKIIQNIMPAQNFYIALTDDAKEYINFVYFVDEMDEIPGCKVALGKKTISGYVLRSVKSLLCDKEVSDRLKESGEVLMAGTEPEVWLGAPLMIDGEPIGLIAMQHYHDPNAYSKSDQQILEFVSTEVAKAIYSKRTEDALLESEQRFRSVVENSPMGIFICDVDEQGDLILLDSNHASNQIFRKDFSQYLGQRIIDIFPGGLNINLDSAYLGILSQGGVAHLEKVTYQEDGHIGVFDTFVFPISQGSVAVLYQDVSDRLKTEEEIRSLNEELEDRVVQRTADLEAANREMEAFAYSVSHDLRAPVRSIKGFSELLQQDLDGLSAQEVREYLDRIYNSSIKMDKLIDDLLSLSYLENQELNIQSINLGKIVSEISQQVMSDFKGTDFTLDIQPTPDIRADSNMIDIMMTNLLANAFKFTANRPDPTIRFGYKEHDNRIVFFLEDNGIGFDMAYAEKIFAPFERLNPIEYEGTGIGLAIVRRVVQRHNGRISAVSSPDEGAAFNFYFDVEHMD